jgi:hypothetical protein
MKKRSQLQQGTNLADQLDTYSASVRANQTAGWWSKRIQRWTPYAAAVGSGLALTTALDAAIIYSGPQSTSVTAPGNGTFGANVYIGGRTFRLAVEHQSSLFSHKGVASFRRGNGDSVLSHAGVGLKRLSQGAVISNGAGGSTAGWGGDFAKLAYRRSAFGNPSPPGGTWEAGQSGFAGIRLNTAHGQTDYGWIRLEWLADTHGDPVTLKDDWAYDDSGAPIAAGAGAAVPEPSSLALVLLAAGSAGVLAWRKRHRTAAPASSAAG